MPLHILLDDLQCLKFEFKTICFSPKFSKLENNPGKVPFSSLPFFPLFRPTPADGPVATPFSFTFSHRPEPRPSPSQKGPADRRPPLPLTDSRTRLSSSTFPPLFLFCPTPDGAELKPMPRHGLGPTLALLRSLPRITRRLRPSL